MTSQANTDSDQLAGSSSTPPKSADGTKPKQTRKRQRLSCVECTKRRQKCDRQTPCGLCVSRGIAALCRWEPIVVRPAPQRPPAAANTTAADTIQALSARIAALEDALLKQSLASDPSPSPDDNTSNSDSDLSSPDMGLKPSAPRLKNGEQPLTRPPSASGPRALYEYNVQVAAVNLARMSLAPHEEYVGSGTVLCALHKLGEPDNWRVPFPHTDTLTSRMDCQFDMSPFTASLQSLIAALPSRQRADELLDAFFNDRNWQFGILESWFRGCFAKMWRHLDRRCPGGVCLAPGACTACLEGVNPHWLCLLFAVFAVTPRSVVGRDGGLVFFMQALAARRLVEDLLFAAPVCGPADGIGHGAVLSCIGTALLAVYHADRGRVSEAWKLAGAAVRSAQAIGLHRDPGWRKWEEMGRQEAELRLMAWWSVWTVDRVYSFILGRPMTAPKGSFDITLLPGPVHSDGTPNLNASYLRASIRLKEIIGECSEKCLGIYSPAYATIIAADRRFQDWLTHLPPHLQWRNFLGKNSVSYSSLSPTERNAIFQRQRLAAGFLDGLMNIHRPYLMHPPPILPAPAGLGHMQITLNPSRERCIECAIELVRVLTQAHADIADWPTSSMLFFEYSYFVFDGAVTLAGALSQSPPHPRAEECLELMDKACAMLDGAAAMAGDTYDGEGEIAKRALVVLDVLRNAGGWTGNPHSARHPVGAAQSLNGMCTAGSSECAVHFPASHMDRFTPLQPVSLCVAPLPPLQSQNLVQSSLIPFLCSGTDPHSMGLNDGVL